jgi:hypothetical protein
LVLLGIAFAVSATSDAKAAIPFGLGDVDCSGVVDVVDIVLAIQIVLDMPLTLTVDADGNGEIDQCELFAAGFCGMGTLVEDEYCVADPTMLCPGPALPPQAVPDAWTTISSDGAPEARARPVAVWTGEEVLVWGGLTWNGEAYETTNTGGRYNVNSDAWEPMSTEGAPSPRQFMTGVWTGSKLIVWGGSATATLGIAGSTYLGDGAAYDPAADSWTPLTVDNAPLPRHGHTAVWTGSEMIVWGGIVDGSSGWTSTNTGRRYDPLSDTWTVVNVIGAPTKRGGHVAAWSGTEMIIHGSKYGGDVAVGGRYTPDSNTWTLMAPTPGGMFSGVWNDGYFYSVLTGFDSKLARYDPVVNTWKILTADPDLTTGGFGGVFPAIGHKGQELFVWSGLHGSGNELAATPLSSFTGLRHSALFSAFVDMNTAGMPPLRINSASANIDHGLFIWGGSNPGGGTLADGAVYWYP